MCEEDIEKALVRIMVLCLDGEISRPDAHMSSTGEHSAVKCEVRVR